MKKGFSLIELILSIVIIGLTMAAVPNLISKASDNNRLAIIQESIMDAKTRMALIYTTPWGCVNDPSLQYKPTPVFGNMVNFYTRNNTTANPISGDKRRNFSTITRGAICASWETNIDGYNGDRIATQSSAGYSRDSILRSFLTTAVERKTISGIDGGINSDTKEIRITVTTTGTQNDGAGHTITLRAYSANIGDSPEILTRDW